MADEFMYVSGLKELAAAMRELPERVARNALRAAVNAGATVIKKKVRLSAPKDTGFLKEEIHQKHIRKESNAHQQTYYVGVRIYKIKYSNTKFNRRKGRITQAGESLKTYDQNGAFYWRYLEFGTSKMAARPFLRPAFEQGKEDAVTAIAKRLDERIQKHAKDLAKP